MTAAIGSDTEAGLEVRRMSGRVSAHASGSPVAPFLPDATEAVGGLIESGRVPSDAHRGMLGKMKTTNLRLVRREARGALRKPLPLDRRDPRESLPNVVRPWRIPSLQQL